jgi:hypothetical protein
VIRRNVAVLQHLGGERWFDIQRMSITEAIELAADLMEFVAEYKGVDPTSDGPRGT